MSLLSRIQAEIYVISYTLLVHGVHLWYVTYADVVQFQNLLLVLRNVKTAFKICLLSCVQPYKRFLTKPELWAPSWILSKGGTSHGVGSCTIEIFAPKRGSRHRNHIYITSDSWVNRGYNFTPLRSSRNEFRTALGGLQFNTHLNGATVYLLLVTDKSLLNRTWCVFLIVLWLII